MRASVVSRIAAVIVLVLAMSACSNTKVDPSMIVENFDQRTNPSRFDFPVGYEGFHDDPGINFLLNRTYSMGCVPLEDMVAVGDRISDFSSVPVVMTELADQAAGEERHLDAAFYFRAAELYTGWGNPAKSDYYDRFISQFTLAVDGDDFEADRIEYGTGGISTLVVRSDPEPARGTIILHAGYDGYKEELYPVIRYFAASGYDVITFDVPWMDRSGGPGSDPFSYEWERMVGAVLDHYAIEDATLVGFSMGGWLALRAAAFETRISHVVASSVSYDVNQYAGWFGQKIAGFSLKYMEEFTNKQILSKMESDPYSEWFFDQLMHVTQTDSPVAAAKILSEINEENLQSGQVTQDVLILTGDQDHAIPLKMHNMQVDALVNAASIRALVFTEDSQGHNHCQVGNFGLALSVIMDWLEEVDGHPASSRGMSNDE